MTAAGNSGMSKHYDPSFTADISQRMRVPDRIRPTVMNGYLPTPGGVGGGDGGDFAEARPASTMTVPDKIVILGADRSIGVRAVPDLHDNFLGSPLRASSAVGDHLGSDLTVSLTTPPHTLTLDQRSFPTIGDEPEVAPPGDGAAPPPYDGMMTPQKTSQNDVAGRHVVEDTPSGRALLIADDDGPAAPDSVAVLCRQVSRLVRRVERLDEESGRRRQREALLYPLVAGYILVRLAAWWLRR